MIRRIFLDIPALPNEAELCDLIAAIAKTWGEYHDIHWPDGEVLVDSELLEDE